MYAHAEIELPWRLRNKKKIHHEPSITQNVGSRAYLLGVLLLARLDIFMIDSYIYISGIHMYIDMYLFVRSM